MSNDILTISTWLNSSADNISTYMAESVLKYINDCIVQCAEYKHGNAGKWWMVLVYFRTGFVHLIIAVPDSLK